MALTDTELLKNRQQGQAQSMGMSVDVAPLEEVAKMHSLLITFAKGADDGAAATATTETYTGKVLPTNTNRQWKAKLRSATYVAVTGGITGDNTNNAVITITKRDANGLNPLVIATLTTNVATGNIVQGAGKQFTLTGANLVIDAGSTFTYAIAKGGSGVVVRQGEFTLELEKI